MNESAQLIFVRGIRSVLLFFGIMVGRMATAFPIGHEMRNFVACSIQRTVQVVVVVAALIF